MQQYAILVDPFPNEDSTEVLQYLATNIKDLPESSKEKVVFDSTYRELIDSDRPRLLKLFTQFVRLSFIS